ncbi:DUF6415 family natural product biosynthesis protein [Streptomyces shenzhenensis]|uniref:DUF6415 family natural product biosynthesis protein n=1 Tax=Streptomyces shenzhenensis TaxID=943815 RepID=UPI00381BDCAF
MTHTTAVRARTDQRPPDIERMRATVARLLGPDDAPDALPPAADELPTLVSTLRGHLELLVPEVEAAALRLHPDSIPRYCAIACAGEARGKLRAEPRPGFSGAVAYARRLARVLRDHYESAAETP